MSSGCGITAEEVRPRESAQVSPPREAGGGDTGTTTEGARSEAEEYHTRFPIAWYGASGWKKEIDNRGGERALGVRLLSDSTDSDDDDEESRVLREEIVASMRDGGQGEEGSSSISRTNNRELDDYPVILRPLIGRKGARVLSRTRSSTLALGLVAAMVFVCAAWELLPNARVARFFVTGAWLLSPVSNLSENFAPLRRTLKGVEPVARLWRKHMTPTSGWAVIHVFFGVFTVVAAALANLGRTRALLTLVALSISAASVVGALSKRWKMVQRTRDALAAARRGLSRRGPALRSLRFFVPAPAPTAALLRETLFFLAAAIVPWAVLSLVRARYPHLALWTCGGMAVNTAVYFVLSAVLLAVVCVFGVKLFTTTVDNPTEKESYEQNVSMLHNAFATVTAAFVISRYVFPELSRPDIKDLVERSYFRKDLRKKIDLP